MTAADAAEQATDSLGAPPWRLTLALVVVTIETILESAFVLFTENYGPGGKAFVIAMFCCKILFAVWARRRSAAGVLGLLLFEMVGFLVVIFADFAIEIRLALLATILTVFVLVLTSLETFPTPELPRP